MSELSRRILFAVIAAPVGIALIYLGGPFLATLLSVIAALGAWEFCRIARASGAQPFDAAAIVGAAAIPLLVFGVQLRLLAPTWTHAVVAGLVVFAATIFRRGIGGRPLLAAATTVFCVAYLGLVAYVFELRYDDYIIDARGGTALAMFPILLTWATDIGAYAFGRVFGSHKLMPSVSPGKTIEGSLGGLLLAVVVGLLYVSYVLHPLAQLALRPLTAVLFAVCISVVAQVGDLAESLIKREAGIKDSSTLIPGHGGVLDRFDSLLFVLPVAALLLRAMLIPAPV
ncbi:MAG TPA: phosphatidate cytidylyltransferase [Gemmatimonadaceae bacterium]|nr:phosphatidate cytidylyltransferase [Gemmatimonadaceae bacterium]